jgi:P4 family phage/plasmid primase-like protien
MASTVLEILKSNYVEGVFHTHVSMIKPRGKFLFNREIFEDFWKIYCILMNDDSNLGMFGIAEKPQYYYPVLVDIDIKIPEKEIEPELRKKLQTMEGKIEDHIYAEKHVKQVIEIFQSILRQIVEDCEDIMLTCCLLEKKIYSTEKNGVKYYKSGFHLQFPYVFLSKKDQETYLNPRIIDALKELEVFEDLGFEDSSKLFDDGISGKPWLLYGSRKETSEPYVLTKIYNSEIKEVSIEEAFQHYQLFDNRERLIDINGKIKEYLPRILSIIPYGRTPCELKSGLECLTKERQLLKSKKTCKENLKTTVEENLKISEKLLPMLGQFRAEEYNEWITIGWVMYNIGEGCQEALDQWIDFSSRDELNFDENECISQWEKMTRKDYTIGTLKFYAKTDNPELYREFVKEEGLKYIKMSLEGSHKDLADLLYTEYGTEFVCASVQNKTWYQFVGHHWEEIEEGVFLRDKISSDIVERYGKLGGEYFVKATTTATGNGDGPDEKSYQIRLKQIQKLVVQLKSAPYIQNVMKMAADKFYNKNFKHKLDTNPYLFGFKNGVYDLKLNVFRSGRPEDYISNSAPIDFVNYAPTDKKVQDIHDFLEKVFPDKSVRQYFLDQSSDVFVGGNHQKVVIFWTGEGDNGKSVTQSFFDKMLGTLAIKFSTTLITGKKTQIGAAGPELARAGGGVRWAVLEEPDGDEEINVGMLKSLSGNDSYWARDLFEKGKSTREIQPLFKLVFICNNLPSMRYSDKATWNRIRVIPFETTFVRPGDSCPDTYEEQLRDKRFPMDAEFSRKIPGLLPAFAWVLLEHRKSILGKERVEPEKVRMATAMYRKQNDIYRQFIEERIIEDQRHIRIDEMYEDFKVWYRGGFPGNSIPVKNDVKEYFCKVWGEPEPGIRWYGYRLRTIDDDVKEGNAIVLDDEDLVDYNNDGTVTNPL